MKTLIRELKITDIYACPVLNEKIMHSNVKVIKKM